MGILKAIGLLPVLIGLFAIQVNWTTGDRVGVNIRAEQRNDFVTQCLKSGLQLRYRYQTKLCYRRSFWFDSCGKERTETHDVQYDPISEQYQVTLDVYHDAEGPVSTTVVSSQEALEQVATLKNVDLKAIDGYAELPPQKSGTYLGVRVLTECKGDSGGILTLIPTILTFGIVDPAVSDSGWVGFDLERSAMIMPVKN